jgi:hypothetical protein
MVVVRSSENDLALSKNEREGKGQSCARRNIQASIFDERRECNLKLKLSAVGKLLVKCPALTKVNHRINMCPWVLSYIAESSTGKHFKNP